MSTFTEANITGLAPVAVYTYTRVEHFTKTIEALRNNYLAPHTVLYVVSDGPKTREHAGQVSAIRDFVESVSGFREIVKIYRNKNLGMAASPPLAELQILGDHGKIINMEDDNLSSRNYLDFMNAGLLFFEDDPAVYSVSAYRPAIDGICADDDTDFFYYPWNMAWGYGVWKKKHEKLHPLINRYVEYRKQGLIRRQNRSGGLYVSDSLRRDFNKVMYFPDAVIGTEMYKSGMRTILPVHSKILNIGHDGSGQSSSRVSAKYNVAIDVSGKRKFSFCSESCRADDYRRKVMQLFNGGPLIRATRRLGIYHEALQIKNQFLSLAGR